MRFKLYFSLILTALLGYSSSLKGEIADSTTYFIIKDAEEKIRQQYIPDGRTKLLEINRADLTNSIYTFITTEQDAKTALVDVLKGVDAEIVIDLLPDTSVQGKPYGIVNLSVANLRTRPSHAAEMATQIIMGTQVDILQKTRSDYRIRTPEGYIAWIPISSIVAKDTEELQKWKEMQKLIYTQDFGKSYSEMDIKSQRVSDLVYGNILAFEAETDDFYKVNYADGKLAFIAKEEAVPFEAWLATRKASRENIIRSAKSMLGLPYLWGGTSVKGVDCSGFTKTTFFMNGYIIPRDASQQVLSGEAIDILDKEGNFDSEKALKNLQPADLLFFAAGKKNNPNARVTHVAIYLGDGEFIHSAGNVRINSMLKYAENYDDFQTRTVVAAKRYLGSEDETIQPIGKSKYYQ